MDNCASHISHPEKRAGSDTHSFTYYGIRTHPAYIGKEAFSAFYISTGTDRIADPVLPLNYYKLGLNEELLTFQDITYLH